MDDGKAYRLTSEDVNRIDHMIERVHVQTQKLGMKKVKQSIMLRALVFCGENITDENLLEALKKAYMCS